ncbi:MAG TPA: cytidylate kinase-like family protein [Gemmatimonadaceae bacterium]|nr:cytidylate kinase-like family protein [Gemmatimonadaceae bacterium]
MAVITISRMYGSGGSEVAQRVATALGWTLLDNALVDAVAQRLGVSPADVEAVEEKVPSLVQRLADAMAYTSPELAPATAEAPMPPNDERVVEVTHRIITEAVQTGNVVLVGRGAQCMLAARQDAVHAFCYAPMEALVARVSGRRAIPPDEARREVEETNTQREHYVKAHFKRKWKAHENYHLCLNTAWLGTDGAADLVLAAARTRLGA